MRCAAETPISQVPSPMRAGNCVELPGAVMPQGPRLLRSIRCGQQHSAVNEKGPDRSGPWFAVSESKARLPATAVAIAAVATIAATAAIAAEASAARTTTAGAWLILGFINAQLSAVHRITVQTLDRTRRISLAHLDETEASRPAGLTIRRQRYGIDIAMLREQCAHVRLTGCKRQVTHVDLRHKNLALPICSTIAGRLTRQEQQPRSGRGRLTSHRCRYPVTMIATRTVNDRFSFYHRYLNFKLALAGRDGAILSP